MPYPELSVFEATFIVLPRCIVYYFLGISLSIICGINKISIGHSEGIIINYYSTMCILLGVLKALIC